jgi:hypothetical protein
LKELDACVGRIEGIDRRLHELGVPFPVRLSPLPDRGKVVAALHDTWDWLDRWKERSQPKQAREDRIEPQPTRVDHSKLARQLAEALPHSRVTAISLYRSATGQGLRESMDAIDKATQRLGKALRRPVGRLRRRTGNGQQGAEASNG